MSWVTFLTDAHTGQLLFPLDIPSFSWEATINDSSLSTTKKRNVGKDEVQSLTIPWSALPAVSQRQRFEMLEPGRKGLALFWKNSEDEENNRLGTPILWGVMSNRSDDWDSTSFTLDSVMSVLSQRFLAEEGKFKQGYSPTNLIYQGMSYRGILSEVGYACTNLKPGGGLPVDWSYRGEKHVRQPGQNADVHTRTYPTWNVANQSGKQIFEKICQLDDGPDIQFRPYLDQDETHVRLRFESGSDENPDLSQDIVQSLTCWNGGGTFENVKVSYTTAVQRVYATGAGQDALTTTAFVEDLSTVLGSQNVLLRELAVSDSQCEDDNLLRQEALAELNASKYPLMQISGDVHFNDAAVPQPGSFWPGQIVNLDLQEHPTLPDGTYRMRLMSMRGNTSDACTLTFDATPVPYYKDAK